MNQLNLIEKLRECMRFDRNKETEIILEGIKSRLTNPNDYSVLPNQGKISRFFRLDPISYGLYKNEKAVCALYTGDHFGTRCLSVFEDIAELIKSIDEVSNIIPRKLTINYNFSR